MSVGGIDYSGGHVGMSQSVRASNTLGQVGSAMFNVGMGVAEGVAMGVGGPIGAAAVSGLRGGISAAGGTSNVVGASGANAAAGGAMAVTQNELSSMKSDQLQLMQLQMAMNRNSQQFTTASNVTKSKHDAAMSAIQNTR